VELPDSIEPDQLKWVAVALMGVVVFGGLLLMRSAQKLVFRVLILLAMVAVGVLLFSQREDLDECQRQVRDSLGRDCSCTFAGFTVQVPGCDRLRSG